MSSLLLYKSDIKRGVVKNLARILYECIPELKMISVMVTLN